MTTLDRLDRWKAGGVISADQHVLLQALVRQDRFSLFVEISALLYIGVLAVVGGLIWTFRDYVVNLGDAVILSILALLMAVSFYYCFSRGLPYDHDEVESPSMIFDYVLYFGCLVLSATLGFIETRFVIFQGWTTHLLIASVVFGLLAYRFDNRFVLSLAISTMAGYLGLKLDLFDRVETDILRLIALAFGTALIALGVWLHRQAIKPHFLETYIHVGANVIMMATASGVLEPRTGWLYLAALLSLSAAAIYLGVRFDRFAFVAYGTLYGYAGVSARLLESIGGPAIALWYFVITGTVVVIGLTVVARRFARDE
jgi:hypothetical protein